MLKQSPDAKRTLALVISPCNGFTEKRMNPNIRSLLMVHLVLKGTVIKINISLSRWCRQSWPRTPPLRLT